MSACQARGIVQISGQVHKDFNPKGSSNTSQGGRGEGQAEPYGGYEVGEWALRDEGKWIIAALSRFLCLPCACTSSAFQGNPQASLLPLCGSAVLKVNHGLLFLRWV